MSDKRSLLGQRIRAARKERHLSQRELAKRSGVSFTTIQRIETENRKTTTNNLAAVLRALDSVAELDGRRIFEGFDDDEVIDVLNAINKQDRDETVSGYVWRQEEITRLVKKIHHTPHLDTLLEVTHSIYIADLFVRGKLIGRDQSTEEILDIDKQPDALDSVGDIFEEE